ncbi:hypothetical protein P7K49_022681, partial [Saguinus oedipus]
PKKGNETCTAPKKEGAQWGPAPLTVPRLPAPEPESPVQMVGAREGSETQLA